MEPDRPSRRALVGDAILGAAVFVVVAVAIAVDIGGERGPDLLAYLFAACLGALMLVRRRYPVLALVATAVGLVAYYTFGYPAIGLAIPVAAAMYSAAEAAKVRWAAGTAVALLVVSTIFRLAEGADPAYLFGLELATNVGLLAAAIALGDGVRVRRALRAEQEERARRAEVEREREAERRVREERLRIARDLHDVLAHTATVVTLQADVAAEALDDDPAAARAALATIRNTSDRAVHELRTTVRVLRDPGEAESRTPVGGLEQLATLVERTEDSGLPVTVRTTGEPVSLPLVVDSTAYRIVQEALTNALRHSGASHVDVDVAYEPGRLVLAISDDGRGMSAPIEDWDQGRGIRGMRERAQVLGGAVEVTATAGGGVRVEAWLPLEVGQ